MNAERTILKKKERDNIQRGTYQGQTYGLETPKEKEGSQ
jgi:hypothetical protein